jgi:hypothetical protein
MASPSWNRLEFQSYQDVQAENFRKMLMAMARDLRVVLIKLADRPPQPADDGRRAPGQASSRIAKRDAGDLRADCYAPGPQQHLRGICRIISFQAHSPDTFPRCSARAIAGRAWQSPS